MQSELRAPGGDAGAFTYRRLQRGTILDLKGASDGRIGSLFIALLYLATIPANGLDGPQGIGQTLSQPKTVPNGGTEIRGREIRPGPGRPDKSFGRRGRR